MNGNSTPVSLIRTLSAKLVLVGESGVGKSSIISRYINDTFGTMYPEMGIFLSKVVSVSPELPKIKFEIWDTAGQEKYRSITKLYYKDADLILIVFDLSRPQSYEAIRSYWLKEVKNNSKEEAMISIVGNKSDLAGKVDEEMIRKNAEMMGYVYTKTSAKTSEGIQALFTEISRKIIRREEEKENALIEPQLKMMKPQARTETLTNDRKDQIDLTPVNKKEESNHLEEAASEKEISEKEPLAEDKEHQMTITQPESNDNKNEISFKTEDENDNTLERNDKQNATNCDNSILSNVSQAKYERTKSVHSILKKTETKEECRSKCC